MCILLASTLALSLAPLLPVSAAIVGHVLPAEPLTAARVRHAAGSNSAAWLLYLRRSDTALRRDKAVLAAERPAGRPIPAAARETVHHDNGWAHDHEPAWYGSPEARRIADTIVSFQTPAGGWGKNLDRTGPQRVPGQHWIGDDPLAGPYSAEDGAGGWSFVGTLDNEATTTEMGFLASVQVHTPGAAGDPYRASFLRGMRYLLDAQYPNGGWPQVYPLQGGYHDALTLNDDAVSRALALLRDCSEGRGDFSFVPTLLRARAAKAAARALDVLLATQIRVGTELTVWAQQYDPLTLRPVAARNFEPVALATAESAAVLQFLMSEPPSPRIRTAIEAGAAWFRAQSIADVEWTGPAPGSGRRLLARSGAAAYWARFYDPATARPIFADRDRSIHDDVNEISLERRNVYGWFNTSGAAVADAYAAWRRRQ